MVLGGGAMHGEITFKDIYEGGVEESEAQKM